MSQISALSPPPRASADHAEASAGRAGETADPGFAALLAALVPPPVAPPPTSLRQIPDTAPTEPPAPPAAEDAAANTPWPDASPDGAEPPPADADGSAPSSDGDRLTGQERGQRAALPATGDAATPPASPPRTAAPPADQPRGGSEIVAATAAPAGETTRPQAGRAKAAAAALRAADAGAAAAAQTAAGTGRGEAAAGRSGAPVDQAAAIGPRPVFGRHVLARLVWDAELVARQEIAASSASLPVLDGVGAIGGIGERASLTSMEAAPGGAARPVQQLALAIERAVNGEVRQLTVQLSPRELGTIEIAIEIDAERRLSVAILAERPETLELLRQDARQLERLLGQQGLSLAEAGLELGLMGGDQRKGGERPPSDGPDLALSTMSTNTGAEDPPPPAATADASRRLNLSI